MALTAEQLKQMDTDAGLTSSKIAQMDVDAGLTQQPQQIQHDDNWLNQIVTPAQLQQWKKKGHIGAIEAFNRFDKWDMLPYVGGMQDGYDIPIAMKIRAAANGDELSTKDKQDVINFIRDYSEIQARGYSFGGNMVNGGLAGIPFLVEAGVALGTGGLAAGGTASKMAAKGGAKAAVGAAVKSVIGKTLGKEIVEQSAEMAGKTIAKNAAIHTMSVLPSVARNTGHRLINSGIAVTDKGEIYAKQAQESPAIIALKALGETEIELASEMSGGLLFHPLTHGAGAVAKSIMPRKLVSALDQLALTKGGKAVSTMLRARDKVGFNGFLEEMGEEAVGDVLKTTFDLDAKEGYSFDQFLDAATFNRGSDLMVTAGLVAIQGGVSIGTVKAVNALAKSGMPQEKIDEVMAHTSELEKENIAERFNEGGSPAIPESEVVVEAPPGVEQTNEFTAAHSFPETPTLFGSVEQNATPQNQQDAVPPTEETTAQRMDNALATESTNQQQKMNDVAKAGETVNLNAVDKARKNKIRSDIKVIDKQLHTLSKQYDDTAKRMAETTDDKAADKIQKELDRIDAQMTKLSDERDAMELDSELVGKTIANAKNEQVQMTREQANDLQRIDKSKRVLRAIKTGFDSGVAMTKASLKIAQKEYSNLVKMLPKTEREKVAFDFKKFNSVEEAKKNLPEFESKIENILKAVDVTDKHVAIAKALTQKATIKTGSTKKAAFGVEETAVYRDLQEIYRLRELALKSTENEKLGEDNKQKRADAQNRLLEMKFNARVAEKTGSFHERIVNRMLSYATTRPENMSTQEMGLLLDDINRLKEEGRTARDEKELEKRLNKSEIVDDVINAVEKYNAKPPGLLKKFYVNNIANVYSVFNAYMGRAFAEKYDPSLAQSKLSNAVYFSTRKLSDRITKILNAGRIENLPKMVSEMSELNTDWVIKKIDGKVARQLSVFDIMDIYNSIKNEDIAEDYYKAYGKDQIDGLVSQLTPEQMEMADALAKHVRSYESTLNDYNLRKRGLPLEKRANYWPASSESHGDEYDALNTYIPNSNIPSALKIKYGNTVPVPRNAWQKAQKHIYQAEYVANLADTFETIDTMLKDPDASTIIKQTLGDTVYNNLKSELDFMSLQRGIQVNSEFGNALEKALGRWTAAMVASPRVFLRQFTAATTYSAEENMPLATWTKYFAEALAHPQRTIEYMRKEIPYLEARFNEGYDEAIAKAIREATHTSAIEQDWTKAVTFFTKTGDIGSIMFGGYPYYRHMLESGISKEEAIDKFIYTTERITQGKESSNLSTLQKDSRINYFSRFLNSPNQFVRQLVDAQIQMKRGEMSKAAYAKKMSQYLIMQPVLYSAIGSAYKAAASSIYGLAGGSPDDRDFQAANYFFDIMNQIVLVPFAALPLVNELVGFVLNTVEGQPTYGLFESQMITDMADSAVGIATSVKHENIAGVLFHASKVLTVVGVPVKQITDLIDTVSGGELKDSVSNKKKKSMYSNTW